MSWIFGLLSHKYTENMPRLSYYRMPTVNQPNCCLTRLLVLLCLEKIAIKCNAIIYFLLLLISAYFHKFAFAKAI